MAWFNTQKETFIRVYLTDDNWKHLTSGLKVTLTVTLFALVIGVVLGTLLAVIRTSYDQTKPNWKASPGQFFLALMNRITKIYLTVIRGTPMVLQLMIWWFVVFVSLGSKYKLYVAILAFGLNSAAYVTEIIRGGIMSVDFGQMEAGRSLGLNYTQTMWHVVIPQAVKNVIPALGNELITLLKETAVAGFIALNDLTRGADILNGITFEAFMPLMGAALIYLAMVLVLEQMMNLIERRMRASDQR